MIWQYFNTSDSFILSEGRLSYEKLIDLLAYGPIRVHKIKNKCEIKEGNDADFTIVDPKKTHIIKNEEQASKSGWTPYDNKKVIGFPVMTIIRGYIVMRDGDLIHKHIGKEIQFI